MALIPGGLTPQDVGDLLRLARENAKITQAAAAANLEVARTTLVAMEKGQRFAIREGGRTVGAGVVGNIIE